MLFKCYSLLFSLSISALQKLHTVEGTHFLTSTVGEFEDRQRSKVVLSLLKK